MRMNEKRTAKDDEIRREYDFSRGVRGRYAKRFSRALNVVVPGSKASNKKAASRLVKSRSRK